jgi:hypothetical protein
VFLDGHCSKVDDLWQHEANEEVGEKKRQRSHSEKSVYIRSAVIAGGLRRHESRVYFISDQIRFLLLE